MFNLPTNSSGTSLAYDFVFKLVLIGDTGVGKTNLLDRYTSADFKASNKSTIGVEFSSKTETYDSKQLKAQIWDTAGQERFQALAKAYYRGAAGAIVVFDITKRSSFDNLSKWMRYLAENSEKKDIKVTIVGNKADLSHSRKVKENEAKEFAKSVGAEYFECSAFDGKNVEQAFRGLVVRVYEQVKTGSRLLGLDIGDKSSFRIVDGEKVDLGESKQRRRKKKAKKVVCCPMQ